MFGLGLVVLDPITPLHTRLLVEWSLRPSVASSVYFRLRRTPLPEVSIFDDFLRAGSEEFSPAAPITITVAPPASPAKKIGVVGPAWTRGEIEAPAGTKDMGGWQAAVYSEEQQKRLGVDEYGVSSAARPRSQRTCFVVMGSVGLFLALECVKSSAAFARAPISVVSALNAQLSHSDLASWKQLLSSFSTVICIEDDTGALHRHVCQLYNPPPPSRAHFTRICARRSQLVFFTPLFLFMCVRLLPCAPPKVLAKCVQRTGPSCRCLPRFLQPHSRFISAQDVRRLPALPRLHRGRCRGACHDRTGGLTRVRTRNVLYCFGEFGLGCAAGERWGGGRGAWLRDESLLTPMKKRL